MLSKLLASTSKDDLQKTFGYYFLFICLGLDMAIGGPTLKSLAAQTGATVARMGLMFLAASIGYTFGTMAGGRIIDRFKGHPVMGVAQLIAAALIFTVPLAPTFWVLMAILLIKGATLGLINTGANALLLWTHREKVGPFMNALHFFFGLGAFLSPFLVALLIKFPGGYRWAYWILAVIALVAGLRMLTLKNSPTPIHQQKDAAGYGTKLPVPLPLLISAMLFLFFYVGAEITFGGWIYTYAVTLNLASLAGAAYLTSAFWGAFTAGRLISIPAATRFKPQQVITAAITGCLVILALGIVFFRSSAVLWVMALGLGFCMAPIWPTGFTLAGQSMNMTGNLTAIVLLGDSFGGMVLPSAVGKVIESAGARTMVFLIFGSLVLTFLAFVGLLRLRPARASDKNITTTDTTVTTE